MAKHLACFGRFNYMKISLNYFLVGFMLTLWTSCPSTEEIDPCIDLTKAVLKDYTGLDGCTWILELENGDKLEPINLDQFEIVLEVDQEVGIDYIALDAASICMVGEIVELRCLDLWD